MPALFNETELALLDDLDYREDEVLSLSTALRSAGLTPERVAAVLTQARLRQQATAKYGPEAASMLFTRPGLEQATRRDVADYHAARFRAAGVDSVADLGCGIGADSMAFARAGLAVLGVEIDPETASAAAHNLAPYARAEVRCADLTALEIADLADAAGKPPQGLWLDPARRDTATSRRIFDPEAFSPPFSVIESLAATGIPLGVKMGPGMDHAAIPRQAEAEWVSHGGDVVELVLWFNALAEPGVRRRATLLRAGSPEPLRRFSSASDFGQGPEAPLGPPAPFLYEPDGAVIRAGLVEDLAAAVHGHLLDPRIAYVASEEEHHLEEATTWKVLEELPLHTKTLRRWVRERGITSLTIKKRGVDVVPEALRKQLLGGATSGKKNASGGRGSAHRAGTLILTRWDTPSGQRRTAFVVEPA